MKKQFLAFALLFAAPTAFSATPELVELQTNFGTIAIQLDAVHAPITTANFVTYVNNGFYQNTVFHRMIKGFVLQGGGMNKADFQFKSTLPAIVNEANNGLSNLTGTVAMARTNDPNSATSQFFINLVDNTFLNQSSTSAGYAVFGKITPASLARVRKIEQFVTFNELPFSPEGSTVSIDAIYTTDKVDVTKAITRVSINGSGKIVSTPAGIECGSVCTMSQPVGSAMTLTATAAAGAYFAGWKGDCVGFRRTLNLNTKLGNHNCTAIFNPLGKMLQ